MREFDFNVLRFCEYQGKLFAYSLDYLYCSTSIFIRRFLHSDLLQRIDKNESSSLLLIPFKGLDSINEEFGVISYGQIK